MTESESTLSVVSERTFDVLKLRVHKIEHKFHQNIRVARVSHIECCISGHSGHGLSDTFDLLDCHTISYNSSPILFLICARGSFNQPEY